MDKMQELDEQAMKAIHGGITFVYGKIGVVADPQPSSGGSADFNPQPEPPGLGTYKPPIEN